MIMVAPFTCLEAASLVSVSYPYLSLSALCWVDSSDHIQTGSGSK